MGAASRTMIESPKNEFDNVAIHLRFFGQNTDVSGDAIQLHSYTPVVESDCSWTPSLLPRDNIVYNKVFEAAKINMPPRNPHDPHIRQSCDPEKWYSAIISCKFVVSCLYIAWHRPNMEF